VQHGRERRRHRLLQHVLGERRGLGLAERRDLELAQRARAAKVGPQTAQRVVARQLVRTVGADDEHAQLRQRRGERAEQLERRRVGPLQVVEQHHGGPSLGERGERAPDRLEQRRAVTRDRLAELGQQHREVAPERAAPVQRIRHGPEVAAQRRDHRAVRRGCRRGRRAAQDVRAGVA
jgi:hypothetical protein